MALMMSRASRGRCEEEGAREVTEGLDQGSEAFACLLRLEKACARRVVVFDDRLKNLQQDAHGL